MGFFGGVSIKDKQTREPALVDVFQNLKIAELVRLVGTTFNGATKDTQFWAETVVGSGSVTQTGGQVVLATGVTANSTVQYQTNRVARFVPGVTNIYRGVLKLGDTGTANNTRNWGAFNSSNGVFFQLTGTTLNIVTRAAGVDILTPKASWNQNTSFVMDTNYHSYEIHLSYVHYAFYIDGVLVHDLALTSSLPSQSLHLPSTIQNNNSGGGTSNVHIDVTVNSIYRFGKLETASRFYHQAGATAGIVLKNQPGRLHRIINNTNVGSALNLYDALSATNPICLIDPSKVVGSINIDLDFNTGLFLVTSGNVDVTIVYE